MTVADPVRLRVASTVYAGMRRAYGYVPDDERVYDDSALCPGCGGDGCKTCDWTGETDD